MVEHLPSTPSVNAQYGTVMAQGWGGKVKEVLSKMPQNMRTAGVGHFPLPTWCHKTGSPTINPSRNLYPDNYQASLLIGSYKVYSPTSAATPVPDPTAPSMQMSHLLTPTPTLGP